MKVTTMFAVAALPYAPLALAGNKAAYPNEKVVQFVVEKLDHFAAIGDPSKEGKSKEDVRGLWIHGAKPGRTRGHPGAPGRTRKFSIKILDQQSSGIYVCLAEPL